MRGKWCGKWCGKLIVKRDIWGIKYRIAGNREHAMILIYPLLHSIIRSSMSQKPANAITSSERSLQHSALPPCLHTLSNSIAPLCLLWCLFHYPPYLYDVLFLITHDTSDLISTTQYPVSMQANTWWPQHVL